MGKDKVCNFGARMYLFIYLMKWGRPQLDVELKYYVCFHLASHMLFIL